MKAFAVSLAYSTVIGCLAYSPGFAESNRVCRPLDEVRLENESLGRKWEELSREQWYFLAGIYSVNPDTPPGLPFGNKAVLITQKDAPNLGMIVFVDGPMVCVPMPLSEPLLTQLREVGVKINHAAGAL